jgi:signal transduction histidine kinase
MSSAQQNQEIVVTVADTGPGITAEELPFLFEKYRRAVANQQREGVGLGLFIVKALVEAHGGRIKAESTLGSGSCFAVFLPVASTGQAEQR